MTTTFRLKPDMQFDFVDGVEPGAIYVADSAGSLELAVGFRLRRDEGGRTPTGLLFLTGSNALAAVFFVADWLSDIQKVLAADTGERWESVRLDMTPVSPMDPIPQPQPGSIGVLRNYPGLHVCVRAGNPGQTSPLFVDLSSMQARASDNEFLASFESVKFVHPLLPGSSESL